MPRSLVGRVIGWISWLVLAALSLAFLMLVLLWLLVMALINLIGGWIRGQPSTVGMLWQQYRNMARQRWPQRPGASPTPRADAAQPGPGGATPHRVQDVRWRDLPPGSD